MSSAYDLLNPPPEYSTNVYLNTIYFADGTSQSTAAAIVPGPTGMTGMTGNSGNTGPSGATGPTGAIGPSGASGPIGATGASGPMGATGASGPIGATGPSGASGAIGATGPTGAGGPSGPTGLPGSASNTGATGPTGPGSSATEGSFLMGFTGPWGSNGITASVDFYVQEGLYVTLTFPQTTLAGVTGSNNPIISTSSIPDDLIPDLTVWSSIPIESNNNPVGGFMSVDGSGILTFRPEATATFVPDGSPIGFLNTSALYMIITA